MTGSSRVVFSGQDALRTPRRRELERLLGRVLRENGLAGLVSIVFVGDEEIRRLHREFLGVDRATDVITFPLEENEEIVDDGAPRAEIVVSVETARREAGSRGLPVERELALYCIHGVLHLAGYDDIESEDRRQMRTEEAKRLELLGW